MRNLSIKDVNWQSYSLTVNTFSDLVSISLPGFPMTDLPLFPYYNLWKLQVVEYENKLILMFLKTNDCLKDGYLCIQFK